MAKKDQQSKPSSLDIVKRKYPNYLVTEGKRWDSNILDNNFLVVSKYDGILFVKENQGKVIEIQRMAWEQLPEELTADQMFTKRKYLHNDSFYLSVNNNSFEGREIVRLIEEMRKVILLPRPWYRKIYGYRSKSTVKSVIASIIYAFMLMTILVSCVGDDELDTTASTDSSEVNQVVETVEEPVAEEVVEEPEVLSTTLGDIEVKPLMNGTDTEEVGKYAFISTTKEKITSDNLIKFFEDDISKLDGTNYLLVDLQDGTALHAVGGMPMFTYGSYDSGTDGLSSQWENIYVDSELGTVTGELHSGADSSNAMFTTVEEPEVVEVEEPVEVVEEPQPEYFENCTDLRTAYPAGVDSSHPAYQSKMDRDKDGYACEQ